jgi:hypothetical protein
MDISRPKLLSSGTKAPMAFSPSHLIVWIVKPLGVQVEIIVWRHLDRMPADLGPAADTLVKEFRTWQKIISKGFVNIIKYTNGVINIKSIDATCCCC